MGYYTSFHKKPSPSQVIIHVRPIYTSRALPANMVSVIENYSFPKIKDITFLALAIPKKDVQKAIGKRLRTKINILHLQWTVDQRLLKDDNNGGKLTPIKDIDKLKDTSLPIQTLHIISPAP